MLANRTSREAWKTSFVPLPWWTSQSSTKIRSRPSASNACRAATATLLNRQKPIAVRGSAWWPGGRSPQKPTRASPPTRASTIATAPPAACSAASYEPALATVAGRGRRVRPGARNGVGVEGAAARLAHEADLVDVGGRMDRVQGSRPHLRGLAPLVAELGAALELVLDRRDAPGTLGMRAGVVAQRGLVAEVERGGDAGTVIAR